MKNIFLLIYLTTFFNYYISSQQKLTPDKLKEDLTILGDITIGLSPKLTQEDRVRIDQLIQTKKKELEGKMLTPMEFFNFLSVIEFETKFDEHASLSITEEVMMSLLNKSKLFPLPIKIIGERVVVNSSDTNIPFGSIIYSINGIRTDSLLKSFTKKINDTFVKRRLELQFSIVYLIKKGSFENFQIEYIIPSNSEKRLKKTILGIDFNTYKNVFSKIVFPLNQLKLQNLINTQHFKEINTFYLQLNRFDWDNTMNKGPLNFINSEHKNFNKKFNTIFKEISDKKVENLIIDLRFNGGGNVKVPGILYSYIASGPFTENVSIAMQDFEIPYIELIRRITGETIEGPKEVEKFIKRYKKRFIKQNDSSLKWLIIDNEKVEPKKNVFKGDVYLIVGGRSASASSYFAALFKSNKRGKILGEEMGGSYRSLSAGQILTYQLPNTKLELKAPIMEVNFPDELYQNIKRDRIVPDFEFNENEYFDFFLMKKDIEIEKIIELIKSGN